MWDLFLSVEVQQLDMTLTQQVIESPLKKYSAILFVQLFIIAKVLPVQDFGHKLTYQSCPIHV